MPPRPTRISTFAPESETGPWFFCLRHPVENGSIRVAMVGELDLATAARAGRAIRRAQGDAAEAPEAFLVPWDRGTSRCSASQARWTPSAVSCARRF